MRGAVEMAGRRLAYIIIVLALFAAAWLRGGDVESRWSSYHDFTGRCLDCHLTEPEPGQRTHTFRMDVTNMCVGCHDDIKNLSHPVDVTPRMDVPPNLPLDWKGQVTCVTCHPAHGNGHGDFRLRSRATGPGFCLLCHSDIEEEIHKVTISSAHVTASTGSFMLPHIQRNMLDDLSIKCLSCHDAVFGTDSLVEKKKDPLGGFFHNTMGIGLSHPIGMNYIESRMKSPGAYRKVAELPEEIKLFGGVVGCGSCHNPYSTKHDDLVMSNDGSRLCMACHVK